MTRIIRTLQGLKKALKQSQHAAHKQPRVDQWAQERDLIGDDGLGSTHELARIKVDQWGQQLP